MIGKEINIKCGWCSGKHKAEEWNELTYSECKSREMRRAYTEIYKESTFSKGADTYYKCPSCGTWSKGCQLSIVDTEDRRLLRLGGEPVLPDIIGKE